MNLSTSPFTLGWRAVTLWCWNPSCFANSLNSLELNGGPLSLSILLGVPYVAKMCFNRPFAGSGHMVRNKLCWDANDAVGLPKQRKVGLDWYEFLCFGSPTASFASQRNLFRTM